MSSTAQVALLPPRSRREAPAELEGGTAKRRTAVSLVTFAGLGLYGVLRWSTLLGAGEGGEGRLLGVLGLAVLLAGVGGVLARRSRLLVLPVAVIAVLTMFLIAGIPLQWIVNFRIAVAARAIGDGLSALPGLLVPYQGYDPWVRAVIVLGAGVLLMDAALVLALAPRGYSELRRAGAAVALIALAAVPTTAVHPRYAYLDGLVLFALLAAFIWGERIQRGQLGGAVVVCGIAALAGFALAPSLDQHRPWLNTRALADHLAPAQGESFNWAQSYGPISWPRNGDTVLEVQANRGDYWKAENLDMFTVDGWSEGTALSNANAVTGISPDSLHRWTQTLKVTLRSMQTAQVIAAGAASGPLGVQSDLQSGPSPGTWTASSPLGPGDSYAVRVYDPEPSPAQLAAAGTGYPQALLPGYLTLAVPATGGLVSQVQQVLIAPFGSTQAIAYGPTSSDPAVALDASPYARAYQLARRPSATPYAYVRAVLRYLANGYSYNEDPPPSRYPLASFLFTTHAGYCQQFAGAMALLLRLGGVPARVAAGFTSGAYDGGLRRWVVSDFDAHAWVEAFFPGYGWVRFDPTPAADPARGGRASISSSASRSSNPDRAAPPRREGPATPSGPAGSSQAGGMSAGTIVLLGVLALALAGTLALAVRLTKPLDGTPAALAELERAFARTGRPLEPGVTLAAIERRLVTSPAAAEYVRGLRLVRFAGGAAAVSAVQRRALRVALREGLGPVGWVRAIWALPPRRVRSDTRRDAYTGS
jgi:hypothetical protein